MWLDATRVSTAPGSMVSRITRSPVVTAASARVVGMPSACMASLTRYSRSTGPSAARPSPPREKGVRPAPLSCTSRRVPPRSTTSPSRMARPSPSCGTKPPNWCPAYAVAMGVAVSGMRFPARTATPSSLASHSGSMPSSVASGAFTRMSRGAATGVGVTRAKNRSGSRAYALSKAG